MKASSLAPSPVTSMMYVDWVTSRMRPRKMSATRLTSSRAPPATRTLTSMISRSTCASPVMSRSLTTSMSLFNCFVICSMISSEPEVTRVILDAVSSSVGATDSDSML